MVVNLDHALIFTTHQCFDHRPRGITVLIRRSCKFSFGNQTLLILSRFLKAKDTSRAKLLAFILLNSHSFSRFLGIHSLTHHYMIPFSLNHLTASVVHAAIAVVVVLVVVPNRPNQTTHTLQHHAARHYRQDSDCCRACCFL